MDERGNVFVSQQGLQVFLLFKLSRSAVEPPGIFSAALNFANTSHLLPRLSMNGNRQFINTAE